MFNVMNLLNVVKRAGKACGVKRDWGGGRWCAEGERGKSKERETKYVGVLLIPTGLN